MLLCVTYLYLPTDHQKALLALRQRRPDLKVLVGIGGPNIVPMLESLSFNYLQRDDSMPVEYFPKWKYNHFASDVREYIVELGIDGIDVNIDREVTQNGFNIGYFLQVSFFRYCQSKNFQSRKFSRL